MRVLLVADNAAVRQQIETALLGTEGLDLFQVSTPQRGLAVIDGGEHFDVIVGDADTAPAGGFYLAREVKARDKMGRSVPPVILLLARTQDIYLSNWSQADAYVLKPVNPFDFAEALRSVGTGGPVPALPGMGGDPTPSLLDVPGEAGTTFTEQTEREPGEPARREVGGGP